MLFEQTSCRMIKRALNMRKFEKKQKTSKIKDMVFSVPFIVIFGVVCSLSINATWDIYKKARNTKENMTAVTKIYNELKIRELELMKKTKSLETPLGIETEIREKFGLVKDREEMIVIVDPPKEEKENNSENADKKSLWEKIKGWF